LDNLVSNRVDQGLRGKTVGMDIGVSFTSFEGGVKKREVTFRLVCPKSSWK